MVKLTWKEKADRILDFENVKKTFSNYFEPFKLKSSFNKEDILSNSISKKWNNKLFWGDNLKVLYYLLNNFEEN